ncbi:MAG TPA: glycoside hydrolase family 3 N-terminal domain-containing protein [Bacteroidota bacterium]|nr:glycoside hydrolase family 3 N-terminal domain-containing protein [Bacteroidota bacterium]
MRVRESLAITLPLLLLACRTASVTVAPARPAPARQMGSDWSAPGAIDSLIASMTLEEKIAQMIMVRAYGHYYSSDSDAFERLARLVAERKIGGILMAQGDVYSEAVLINRIQSLARMPLLVAADFEQGVAMRVRRSTRFPDAMAIGATRNSDYAYRMGKAIASEARAIGIHQNYAPVADVNDNPLNPAINTRAFSDNVALVRTMVSAFVRGTIDGGAVATAKHFPGHGDTGTDSHLDLPMLDLTRTHMDSVELSSFRAALDAGAQSVMVGHLAVPALDSLRLPASLSEAMVENVLRRDLGFDGLVVTDDLEMQALERNFPADRTAVLAVRAGVDMLLVPPDVDGAISAISAAVRAREISEARIDQSLRRILLVKRAMGLDRKRSVDLDAISGRVATRANRELALSIARDAVTVLRNVGSVLPLKPDGPEHVVCVLAGDVDDDRTEVDRPGSPQTSEPAGAYFSQLLRRRTPLVETIRLSPSSDTKDVADALARMHRSDCAILCLFVRARSGGKNQLPDYLQTFCARAEEQKTPLIICAFGNPYVASSLSGAASIVCLYGDDEPTSQAAAEALFGEIPVHGRLPVSIPGRFLFGSGIDLAQTQLRRDEPATAGFDPEDLQKVDDLLKRAIADSAFPGAQLAIVKDGLLIYDKSFGHQTYDPASPEIDEGTLFDLASVSKAVGTTGALMKLYDQGVIGLDDSIGKYLPLFAHGEDSSITIRDLLLHRGGFPPFRRLWLDCLDERWAVDTIARTRLVAHPGDSTIYSDLGMITLGKLIEKVTGVPLDEYVRREFTEPLRMRNTMYTPPSALRARCAPTELDTLWRKRLVQGTVHDENAAFLGGVSGNAGLFSTATDLALYVQMLLNKGFYAGRRYFSERTVAEFLENRTGAQERWLGWEMRSPRRSSSGSLFSGASFGHTGFTGTSIWADPERKLTVIFLTNRVYPTRANNKITTIRPALHDLVMRSLGINSPSE